MTPPVDNPILQKISSPHASRQTGAPRGAFFFLKNPRKGQDVDGEAESTAENTAREQGEDGWLEASKYIWGIPLMLLTTDAESYEAAEGRLRLWEGPWAT